MDESYIGIHIIGKTFEVVTSTLKFVTTGAAENELGGGGLNVLWVKHCESRIVSEDREAKLEG